MTIMTQAKAYFEQERDAAATAMERSSGEQSRRHRLVWAFYAQLALWCRDDCALSQEHTRQLRHILTEKCMGFDVDEVESIARQWARLVNSYGRP